MVTNFVIFDLSFLAVFVIALAIFLFVRRKNVASEGILYLYRTKLGIKYIDKIAKKYEKILRPAQYVVVAVGYALMAFAIWAIIQICYIYFKLPHSSPLAKVPPIFPLLPYFNDFLGLKDIFPVNFSFTYFIISIAIIAVCHEFFHGIFARLNNIRIKSTGFAFLGPLAVNLWVAIVNKSKKAIRPLAISIVTIIIISIITKQIFWLLFLFVPFIGAFVEQNDSDMKKAKKFPQLAVLAAGVFANILVMILFAVIFFIFFALVFVPAGVYFTPAYATLDIQNISSYHTVNFGNVTYLEVLSGNQTYFASSRLESFIANNSEGYINAYMSSPAFNSQLSGAISEFDGVKITSYESLRNAISSKSPGDTVLIKTIYQDQVIEKNVQLANYSGKAFLGISQVITVRNGVLAKVAWLFNWGEDPTTYYISKWGDFGFFIKDLFWWLIILNFAVAFTNMIPAGIFDGGRFFYLTVFKITGSHKVASKSFKVITYLFLAILLAITFKWVWNRILIG